MITVTFTKGATIEDIDDTMGKQEPHTGANGSPLKGEFDFEILVPHYSQRIYDDEKLLDYEATVAVTLVTGWKLISGLPNEPIKYKLPKMTDKDTIQAPLKESDLAVLIFEEIITESNSNSNHTNEPPKVVCVHINFQTPTILLSIHKPDKFKEDKDLAYRPEAERDDTNETFGTAYAGIMLRNEDNDDDDPDPIDSAPLPRDNDDDKPSDKDDDLVGLKIQTRQPKDFAFKDELMLKLKFDHNDNQIRVYDGKSKSGATKVSLEILDTGVPLNKEASSDEHLYTAVKTEEETLYIEGLGSSESPEAERYGDKPLKVTLCIEPGTTNKKYSESIGLLMHLEIVPDYNRDGMINAKDRAKVTEDNPWRWWINDDKDNGDYAVNDESDVTGQSDGNFSDDSINGVSDLTDFFPIFLDIKHALKLFPPGDYDYKLSQDGGALNFAEAPDLIPENDPDENGAGAFWRSAFWAETYKNLPVQQATKAGVSLSHSFLDGVKEGRGILLMECRYVSDAPLNLEIWKGEQKVTTIAFKAKIDAVEKMYRHLNLYEATETESSQLNNMGEPENYPDKLSNDKAFAMIHGYAPRSHGAKNDKIQRGFQSTIFTRLHQTGSKAKYVAVYWDSATGLDYHKAVYHAFKTSPLVEKLGSLDVNEITVGAHSLGNIVVSNAICHEGFRAENYFLINAASPIEAYNPGQLIIDNQTVMKTAMTEKEWKPYDERFHSPNWHARFPANDNRSKLKWKGRFANIGSLTIPFNFYSTGEDVVANPESDNYNVFRTIWKKISEDQDLGRFAWVGQEFIKGGTSIAAGIAFERNHGGWAFNGRNQDLRFMAEHNPLDPPGTYQIPFPNTANQRLNDGVISEEHLAQFGLFKRFESPAYEALYAPINDANKNWTDAAGFAWQNPHTKAQGSALAGQKDTQWMILATAMPSVSFAAAANDVGNINGFNMNGQKNGWPNLPHRNQFRNDWQHGDFVDIGASYVKNMYKKAIEEGGLDD